MDDAVTQMTEEEIVLETIAHYACNPRAISESPFGPACVYLNAATGAECAVGRCLTRAALVEVADVLGPVDVIHLQDDMLQPQYRGHGQHFWRTLQRLHDVRDNWVECNPDADNRALSPRGITFVAENWPSITLGQIIGFARL